MPNATYTATEPNQLQSPQTHDDLHQFIGDLVRYTHPLNRKVIYTPGFSCSLSGCVYNS